ncbi:hypothetical protein ACR3AN_001604 [Escherichia coli]|uniref:hypothetical protein n=1 Tax=Escherichia coli TaxID=562 RepID=UPI001FCD80D4|nr:hypothetical protein [Escherichia coli]WNE22119.1 hypothetical protein RJ650_13770 [Escherichia coli]
MNSENSSSVNKKHNKPKQVKLRAFKIENNNLTEKSSPAKKLLLQKLVDSSTVKERCMVLNSDDLRQEQDLISFYQTTVILFFVQWLELPQARELKRFPINFLTKNHLQLVISIMLTLIQRSYAKTISTSV